MVEYGATMEDFSFRILDGKIREIKWFFESEYGYLLSHGLAPVIWEKLQSMFADGLEAMRVGREERIAEEAERKEAEEREAREAEARRKIEQALSEEYECPFEADELPPEEEDDDGDTTESV